ncbi:MAG TPA: NAD(P)H-dependent oxidoreductase, partial [Clostridia bacterium]|nr:NAD(P)H-dependent oxidoreductase [Clostridia bacterium]
FRVCGNKLYILYSRKPANALLPNLKVTIFATMNTPAPIYKLYFGNQVYNAMKKSVFGFAGIKDVKFVPFGTVKAVSASKREKWLKKAARIAGER